MSTDVNNLEPNGIVDANDKATIKLQQTQALMKYCWTGVLLDTDRDGYNKRIGLDHSTAGLDPKTWTTSRSGLDPMIDNLLVVHKDIKAHCTNFKDVTYPSIVSLASMIFDYAQNAGGDADSSYYANILAAGKIYYNELAKPAAKQNQSVIKEQAETIAELIDAQVTAIAALKAAAAQARQDLGTFEGQCRTDQQNLAGARKPIQDKLEGEEGQGGEISNIKKQIKDKVDELRRDVEEYEHDVIVAATAVTYMWLFPFGTIAGAITMGIYSDRARKMAKTIDTVRDLINSKGKELAVDIQIDADLHLITSDIDSLAALIGPAITAIQAMEGDWQAVADDLTALGTAVKDKSAKGNLAVQRISQNQILKKWNALADEVDWYRKNAFVVDVAQVTPDQAKAKLTAT